VNIHNFKQLFSLVFALILAGLFLAFGLNMQNLPSVGLLGVFTKLLEDSTFYRGFTMSSLIVLGLLLGAILGPKIGQTLINTGNAIERMSAREKIAVGFGTFIGVVVTLPFFWLLLRVPIFGIPSALLLCVAFVYLGNRAMMSMKDELRFIGAPLSLNPDGSEVSMEHCKILDTNVIIDGRIADICRTGFIEGPIYVPGFVLEELQHIADSSDSLKRARGRRGLDILNAMQKEFPLIVRTHDYKLGGNGGYPDEVDTRLVRLAKALGGMIVTNDFNLNKVAALQGVTVLNVNELANALKPVVLPGEEMPVTIIKEGKEQNQGVAYLDDGTMIVVEDGRKHIGEHMEVVVTSVLQTVAGKMIFARIKGQAGEEEEGRDGGSRGSGGRPRFKVR
jgi:uncharacterized protein YacL